MAKVRTTITIDGELMAEIAEQSNKEERSLSQQISFVIKKWVEARNVETPRIDRCECENGLTYGVNCFELSVTTWSCMRCGKTETVKECTHNHMFYDCPYCGAHLT